MRIQKPVVDYRSFRIKKLNSDEFRHLKLLLYWPIYGLLFLYVERFYPVSTYYPMHCAVDDLIPFNEFFVIPYLFWFVALVGMLLYTLLYDVGAFKKYMKFIIFTYSAAILIYFIFPTCQNLRPVHFERDNIFTRFLSGFYQFDTHTNVCPSIHVIGALAVLFTSLHTKKFQTTAWKCASVVTAVLICASTVFLKQHSILDVLAALPICLLGYAVCFRRSNKGEPKMEKFASPLARITLILTPILLAALVALGWALIFYSEALLKAVCSGIGIMCLIAAAAICIGLIRAVIRHFRL